MEPKFENAGRSIVRLQTAAPYMNIAMQKEQRPVLEIVFTLAGNFGFKAYANLLSRERPPEKL